MRMPLSVDEVIAHAVYDPVARRQRYLEKRQLKGRQKGQQNSDGGGNNVRPIKTAPSLHAKANADASSARQVAALKARLETLRSALKKLLAEVETTPSSKDSSSSSKSKGGSNKGDKPMTATEKADARKASEKYRKEHPQKTDKAKDTPNQPTKEEQIAHIRSVIKDVRAKLQSVLEQARTQTASNGR
jgi:hypothetical protein